MSELQHIKVSRKILKKAVAVMTAVGMLASVSVVSMAARSNPGVLTPVAGGTVVFSSGGATIDASNSSQGYIVAKYSGGSPKIKVQITGPNGVTYTYNLTGGQGVFPLPAGSGSYNVGVFENIGGTRYSTALQQNISANITNTYGPYLYPNQYVNFNAGSAVVAKAAALSAGCATDLDVVQKVYEFITSNIKYDYPKASTVASGYVPDPDTIMATGTGICLDYAAVMASMLRSQGIPTRLEVGYVGTVYHAWISSYIKDVGWINGLVKFDGKNWSIMDPTFAANSSEATIRNFTGDGTGYQTKYIY